MTSADRRTLSDDEIIAVDPRSVTLLAQVRRIAAADGAVFVQGEPGVGKGLVARALHRHGPHRDGSFMTVDCANSCARADDSEAFEHLLNVVSQTSNPARGGQGAPHRGTLLLDEVGEMLPERQTALLHFLKSQEREALDARTRSGPRLICTSRRDLAADVKSGRLRADLFYRMSAMHLFVPPLRDRPGDILPTAERVLAMFGATDRIDSEFGTMLLRHRWPGNFRELIHTVGAACSIAGSDVLRGGHLAVAMRQNMGGWSLPPATRDPLLELREQDREVMIRALRHYKGDATRAAHSLGLSRRVFILRVHRYKLGAYLAEDFG